MAARKKKPTTPRPVRKVVDHLKCGEPVWRGTRYVCRKHGEPVPKAREKASDQPKRTPKQPGDPVGDALVDERLVALAKNVDGRLEDISANMGRLPDRIMETLTVLLAAVDDRLMAKVDAVDKRLEAIDTKLDAMMELDAKLDTWIAGASVALEPAPPETAPPETAPEPGTGKPGKKS